MFAVVLTATGRLYRALPHGLAVAVALSAVLGATSAALPQGVPVRAVGGALVDEHGPFTVLGASLFWGAWGYRHDRDRLEANLRFLAEHGVSAVRVLAIVGPSHGWEDRTVDPAWPDYDEVIAGLTDLAYDRYGLRVQWTIFGGVDSVPTPVERSAVVRRLGRLLAPRADKVLFVEIANEGYQTGFGGENGVAELRALAAQLRHEARVLVALTAPQNEPDAPFALARLLPGAGVDVATLHHDRDTTGALGAWKPVRAPWSVVGTRDDWPVVLASNEPIGPASSVASENDPVRLVGAALVAWLSGHSVYVLHAGSGIRGGGVEDLRRGRVANYFDDAEMGARLDALSAARRLVPADIARWTPLVSSDARHPFGDAPDVFCAVNDDAFVCAALLPEGPRPLIVARALSVTVLDPLTGVPRSHVALERGEPLFLEAAPGVALLAGSY